MKPESYEELDAYLNGLSGYAWKGILNCKFMGGDERVIRYLRRECGRDLALWSDEELDEYLVLRDLEEDFPGVKERW
jgi:hypothetical protein